MTSRQKRNAWVVGGVAVAVLLSFLVGPLNIVRLFRLHDLETQAAPTNEKRVTPDLLRAIAVGTAQPDWTQLADCYELPTSDATRYRIYPVGNRLTLEYFSDAETGNATWTLCDGATGDELELTHGVSSTAFEIFLSEHPWKS